MTDFLQAYANSRTSANTLVDLVVFIALMASYWKLFEKAGHPGWEGVIPLYNAYKLFEIAMGSGLLFLILLIPGINIVGLGILSLNVARAYGRSSSFAVGLFFLPMVFYPILAFGDSSYYGPKGISGSTYGAGASRTVGFDVRRNSGGTTYYNVDPAEPETDATTVEFEVREND